MLLRLFLRCEGVSQIYILSGAAAGFLWSSIHVIRFSMDAANRAHTLRGYILFCYKWLRVQAHGSYNSRGFSSSTSSLMRCYTARKKEMIRMASFQTAFTPFPVQKILFIRGSAISVRRRLCKVSIRCKLTAAPIKNTSQI